MAKSKKDKMSKLESPNKGKEEPVQEDEPDTDVIDMRTIIISAEGLDGMEKFYTAADVMMEVKYKNTVIGQSEKFLITDDVLTPTPFDMEYRFNVASGRQLDDLISNPLYFSVWQTPGEYDLELYPLESETTEDTIEPESLDGVPSGFEEILGTAIVNEPSSTEEEVDKGKKKKGKGGKEGKSGKSVDAKKSTPSKKSDESGKKKKGDEKKTEDSKKKTDKKGKDDDKSPVDVGPKLVGNGTMSLLPFFLGGTKITETFPLNQEDVYLDDRLVTHDNLPRLTVTVTLDEPLFNETRKLANIVNFTVESIYNPPPEFNYTLDYKIATYLPKDSPVLKPFCLEGGQYMADDKLDREIRLRWQNLTDIKNKSSYTNYSVSNDSRSIKNKIGVKNIDNLITGNDPRIRWNVIKTCWIDMESNNLLKNKLARYRRWPLEFYITTGNRVEEIEKPSKDSKKSSSKSDKSKSSKDSKGSKGSKGGKGDKKGKKAGPIEPIHLMSFADITHLLYPGVTKTRVACELRTYQEVEMLKETGIDDSYFIPKPKPVQAGDTGAKPEKGKNKGKGGKESAKDKKTKETKSTKETKGKDKKGKVKVDEPIEEVIPEPDPSTPIVNENEESTFIIIEVELLRPFSKKRPLEDLTNELALMIPSCPEMPKSVMSARLAEKKYEDCIKKLADEINKRYQEYTQDKSRRIHFYCGESHRTFIEYLQRIGSYQEYLTTLLKAMTNVVNEKFKYEGEKKNHRQYENFISQIYIHLVGDMNKVLNGPLCCGLAPLVIDPLPGKVDYVFQSREAEEMAASQLSERYHNEQLCKEPRNADVWLNYAIRLMLINRDMACECVKESLALKMNQKYSLLLFATILYEDEKWHSSETTFLTLLNYYPKFVEGWVCLYIYYKKMGNAEGADVCTEMITKYSENEELMEDYIAGRDDIAWTTAICPKENKFYRAATILLKLHAIKYAELALGMELSTENGEFKYYHAVSQYLQGKYREALYLLDTARKLHGADFAVNSLIGHCYFQLEEYEDAREAYEYVVHSFNRPDDMHLLYLNLSLIYERQNNLEMTRKYLLHVCKLHPTAYDWLLIGALFYKEDNLINAEACLNESNLIDNRLPETWAYLVLVNLKMRKHWESLQCYRQMKRHDLKNEWLLEKVETEMNNNIK